MIPGTRCLAIPEFRRLFYGQAISQFGDGLYYLMVLFVADKISGGEPWSVALVGFCQAIPFLLLSPWAGQVADRFDRRLIMMASDYASGAVTAALCLYAFLSPNPQVWVLAVAGFALSSVAVFFMPARTAAIPRLVPQDMLLEANALAIATNQLVFMGAQAFSAVVLGAIQSRFPALFFPVAAGLNAVTFIISALYLRGLPRIIPSLEGREHRSTWDEIKDGLAAVKGDMFVPPALLVNFVFHLFISGWVVLYVQSNSRWFGGQYWTLTLVELSFFAVVAISSLIVGRMQIRRIGLVFAAGTLGTSLLCALMAGAQWYPLYLILNALCGITVAFCWLPVATYIQSAFPDEVRGRVSSLWNMVQQGVQPFGYVLIGPVLAGVGLSGTYIFMGVGMALGALVGLAFKGMRDARMPEAGVQVGANPGS
jgi:MFS transporter, DHA3 family, macrolide efflux protein